MAKRVEDSVDFGRIRQQFEESTTATQERLSEIESQLNDLRKQEQALIQEAEGIISSRPGSASYGGRRRRKGRRGRPSGSPRRGRRSLDPKGRNLVQVLIDDILPDSGEGLTVGEATEALEKSGIKGEGEDFSVTVRQSLMRAVNNGLVERPSRGKHILSKNGVKARKDASKSGN